MKWQPHRRLDCKNQLERKNLGLPQGENRRDFFQISCGWGNAGNSGRKFWGCVFGGARNPGETRPKICGKNSLKNSLRILRAVFLKDRHNLKIQPKSWKKGKDPHPQDKIQHLDFTKDPGPLYYKTPPYAFYHKNVRSKAVFGP